MHNTAQTTLISNGKNISEVFVFPPLALLLAPGVPRLSSTSGYATDNIIFGISVPDYPRTTVETTYLRNFIICLLFSRKQQQKLIICC